MQWRLHNNAMTLLSLTQTGVEGFGAFVDFGAGTNGLVHISQLSVRPRGGREVVACPMPYL
jgi:ribosomal protein S1